MTGPEKILAAFARSGTPEFGVVAAYESIFIRDRWTALTGVPWWHAFSGEPGRTAAWAADFHRHSGLEWLTVQPCPSRQERARRHFEKRSSGLWQVDTLTGAARPLAPPVPSGTNTGEAFSRYAVPDRLPETRGEIDALIPSVPEFDRETFLAEGRHDAAAEIAAIPNLLPYGHVNSPLWSLYSLLGYEGMMLLIGGRPELAAVAGERLLAGTIARIRQLAALGARAVWIEECLTDQIAPGFFRTVNLPLLRRCVAEIRSRAMKSIYYYCGQPHDRLETILETGADAVHFEESKKGVVIDIAEMAAKIDGRCVLFGNIDAVGILQNGSGDDLRREIERQLAAGRRNGNRFVLSTGSPITPATPVERVRLYADLVRGGA